MATHKLGKLKINTENGLAFRFGDGKIHRLSFGRKNAEPDINNEEEYLGEDYAQDDFASEEGYDSGAYAGRYVDDDYEDDYQDYDGDGEYDERYDDYEDDRYNGRFGRRYSDDDDYGDDYGDGEDYYDEDYADEDGAYDDRYLDEDAEAYGDEAYGNESPLLRYVDENDWVTYVLLFLLPPLGIYLLWRRRRFELPIRWGVSAASAIWFIIVLILLFSLIFSGSSETTKNLNLPTPVPTAEILEGADITASAVGDGGADDGFGSLNSDGAGSLLNGGTVAPTGTPDALAVDATATPLAGYAGAVGGNTVGTNTVIMTATGLYYHNNQACANIEDNASVSNVTRDVAETRGKVACPLCYPDQKTFYATAGGTYYHINPTCSNMEDAGIITEEAAKNQGKKECPVCIKQEVNSLDGNALKFATSSTKDRSGVTVYATAGGRYFHTDATCSGMKDATSGTLLKAMLAGKTACPTCCAAAGTKVWCTEGGKYYHNKPDCSGMENAYQITLGEAMILGKNKCGSCWGNASVGSVTTTPAGADASGSGSLYVYGTKNGKYYHTNASCSGMTGASRYTLKSMVLSGRAACPTCCSGAETVVYATENGKYYHSYASCSGMQNAQAGTLAQALAYDKQKCGKCWSGSSGSVGGASGSTASGNYVYATKNGKYYHTKSSCSGMTGASKVPINTAVEAGKKACPTCAYGASYKVYSTSGGTYYHRTSNCSGMSGATQRSLENALTLNQKACPVCIGKYVKSSSSKSSVSGVTSNMISSGNYRTGTSGIKVYAVADGKYYHTTSSCSGMKNASYVTLETAMNYGKSACPKCASSANTTVYAVKGGKYYHYSKTCAGAGAVKGKRGSALGLGLDACPYCVTKTKTMTVSHNYKAGTSGIKVYAAVGGKYFHASKACAGASASKITLETALNYSKTACPSCASSASKTVYSTATDKYYHSSKNCAGPDSAAGSFAKALAMGKKECPVCIGGSEAYEVSDIKYSAPSDTNVYIDLDSNMLYYHKAANCSDAGLRGGTKVELGFVVSWGYKACPFCAPATSVS